MIKTAVILAAGKGTRLRSVTNNEIPKPFLAINDTPLIKRSIEKLTECGIEKIIIVTGHLDHFYDELKVTYPNVVTVKNEFFATTGNMKSFFTAKELVGMDDILLVEGDLIYEKLALTTLLNSEKENAILLSEDKYYGDDYAELTGLNKISNQLKWLFQHVKIAI